MISYQTTHLNPGKKDGFSEVLREAQALFADQHLNILGEGYQEIVSDEGLFNDYKQAMMKGVDASEQETLSQLIDNSRITTIQESVSGITPISSLSVPTLRKLWPRMSMKNVIPTEAVKLPRFSISYMLPYLVDSEGTRHYLPEALMEGGSATSLVEGTSLYKGVIELADFTPSTVSSAVSGAKTGFDLLGSVEGSVKGSIAAGDSVDPDFAVTAVVFTDGGAPETLTEVPCNVIPGLQGDLFIQVDDGTHAATLFGRIDRVKGTLQLVAADEAGIKGVKVRGRLSPEYNTRSESVSFEITNRDVQIGTGSHLNAPLPIEFLQDVMAMYNIDGASKVVDIMTNTLALKLDYEIRDFVLNAHQRTPRYAGSFDCKPYSGFSGTPKQWREMLKDVVDHFATTLKQDHRYQGGKFVIVGNEVDINLIPNVSWVFIGSSGERSGVEVDYSIGAVSGVHRYEVVSSPAMPKGSIYVIYVSSQDEQMTYKYFPYAFNVEKGYADPNFSMAPSIMMAKRHKLETFKDAIIKIDVLNNNGDMNFA